MAEPVKKRLRTAPRNSEGLSAEDVQTPYNDVRKGISEQDDTTASLEGNRHSIFARLKSIEEEEDNASQKQC